MDTGNEPADERERRLHAILHDYLQAVDAGQAPDRPALLRDHPEFAADLEAFFADQDRVERVARPMRPEAPPAPAGATMAGGAAATDLPAGTKVRYFGDYEVIEEIARGGMGVVYAAHQISLNRAVALKMILAGELASEADVRRFQAEAEAAAGLDHPNIVPIYEVGAHGGQHYFSMKLVAGGSLARHVPRFVADPRAAAGLLAAVARAVHYAHQRGILHRDLKPANVLLDAKGVPQVTDFGLARRNEGGAALTGSGAIVGTPAYMSPELAAGQRGLTTATDVYSLGAVLYELLTGRAPFTGDSPLEVLPQVLGREPTRPRALSPRTDRDLETVCLKCLEKAPERRYGSAEALAEDLERWLRGEPIRARRSGPWERAVKWARRRPAVAALLVTSLLALVALGGLAAGWWYNGRLQELLDVARNERAEADRQRATAEERERAVNRVWYAADMNLAQRYWDRAHVGRARALLERQRPRPGREDLRGFEWRYLWRVCHAARHTLAGHAGKVRLLAFAPDGRTLATAAGDEPQGAAAVVTLWRVDDGQAQATFNTRLGTFHTLQWSADGSLVGVASVRRSERNEDVPVVVLWERATGRERKRLEGYRDLAFAPRDRLAALVGKDYTVKLWDLDKDQERATFPAGTRNGAFSVAFAPDGRRLAVMGSRDGDRLYEGVVTLWDVATGKKHAEFTKVGIGSNASVAFSPDGTTLAWRTGGQLSLWDTATGKRRSALLEGDLHSPVAIAFSPDSRLLATGTGAGAVSLWDVATGDLRRGHADAHAGTVRAVAFAPDGNLLASAGWDRSVKLWDVASGDGVGVVRGHEGPVNCMAFTPDNSALVTASDDGTAQVWDRRRSPDRLNLARGSWAPRSVAFTADSRTLAAADYRTVRLYDADTGNHRRTIPVNHWVFGMALSPDGQLVATAGNQGEGGAEPGIVRLWDARTGKALARLDPHVPSAQTVLFSPRGRWLAAWNVVPRVRQADAVVTLWEMPGGKEVGTWRGRSMAAFAPDEQAVALVGPGGAALYDLPAIRPGPALEGHTAGVTSAAFSPDGRLIATGSEDRTVRLWDRAGRLRATLAGHPAGETQVTFSPDGAALAANTYPPQGGGLSVKLWDVATATERASFLGGPLLQFAPDGRTVVTASSDLQGVLTLWQVATGQELLSLAGHDYPITCLAISPDGTKLASGAGWRDENDGVNLWLAPAAP
jgi:WD40 repeat protein